MPETGKFAFDVAISHSAYYKIMDTVRTHNIPVHYFSYASAEKCAEQLALFDVGQIAKTQTDDEK